MDCNVPTVKCGRPSKESDMTGNHNGIASQPSKDEVRSTYRKWIVVSVKFVSPAIVSDYSERIAERFNSEPSIREEYTGEEIVKYLNTLLAIRIAKVNGESSLNGGLRARMYPPHPVIPAPFSALLEQVGDVKFSRMGYEYSPVMGELEILGPDEFTQVSNKLERMAEFGLGEPATSYPRDVNGDPQFMSIQVNDDVVTSDDKVHYSQAQLAAFYHIQQDKPITLPLLTFGDVATMRRRVDEFIR